MPNSTLLRPDLLVFSREQAIALLSYFVVIGGAVVAMIFSVMRSIAPKWPTFLFTALSLVTAMVISVHQFGTPATVLFNGMMVVDDYSRAFNIIFMLSALVTALGSIKYLDKETLQYPEYYLLLLFATIGMMWMTSSLELITLFIGLEVMSLSVYSLVGFRRSDRRSNEAAMKYFILGAAASAILLYGSALVYGSTGTTKMREVMALIQSTPAAMGLMFLMGIGLIIAGFLFKIASVPFHMWMPDVYEGAPAPVTGYMTTAVKAASFAIFLRALISLGYGKAFSDQIQQNLHHVIWVVSVLTMVIGNVVALTQTNLKRMLAYSSIAHTGYLLIGFLSGYRSDQGFAPVVIYLASYAAMNLGAFAVISTLASKADSGVNLHDLSGLSKRHPILAFSMAIFMFSMAGVPPTGGFFAKYLLFYSAVQSGEIALTIIGVLCSAISVYYYLRVLVFMYMREPATDSRSMVIPLGATLGLVGMVIVTLQLGLMPTAILNAAKVAVASM